MVLQLAGCAWEALWTSVSVALTCFSTSFRAAHDFQSWDSIIAKPSWICRHKRSGMTALQIWGLSMSLEWDIVQLLLIMWQENLNTKFTWFLIHNTKEESVGWRNIYRIHSFFFFFLRYWITIFLTIFSMAKALLITIHCWNYTVTYKWDKINHSIIILQSSFVVFHD